MSATNLRVPAATVGLASLLLAACLATSGCRSTPTGDLETLRTQPNLPDIHDIQKLALDWDWHFRDKATTESELDSLRKRVEPSEYTQREIEVRERRRVELADEAKALDARRDLIVERVASDRLHARKVMEQLDAELATRAGLARGQEERLLAFRMKGDDHSASATRARAELVRMRRGIEHMEHWQNLISQATTGHARTSGRGWPVLDGEARRRMTSVETGMVDAGDADMDEPMMEEDEE